ncbi:4-hydroxybenzoate octaprenyltransferase [Methylocapsa palsarum]|uniref:4-hydroxybenzoate octaprenyltransferase n=1 Tax=Methylocapsa palsarum TaxID=1612308 RepID=A0A1I3X175_9HYPH|nr:4-hydroxybenzoate octaprenyltransferase [Methylocapsa palsarum]SFK13488.1 4-hydroxybenzoate polyprenyltransferase [Methylocapsa palsarum]
MADQLIFKIAPSSWTPFLQLSRIDRPIGWWLLVLPCWWSSALASIAGGRLLHVRDLLAFLIGAIAMRGAGSTFNDIADRKIDAKVERTRGRPLASGRVSVRAAWVFIAAQCLVGLAVLLSFNPFAIALGFSSMGFVCVYPFMKRITNWPQAVLGAAFAWGGLMGWAVAFGSLALAPVLLYFGAVFWTIGYDTVYAVQDVPDDEKAGIGSTARFFGAHIRAGVGGLYALSVVFVGAAFIAAGAGGWALAGLAAFAAHLALQVGRIDDGAASALRLFRSNRDAGLFLFAGLAVQALSNVLMQA